MRNILKNDGVRFCLGFVLMVTPFAIGLVTQLPGWVVILPTLAYIGGILVGGTSRKHSQETKRVPDATEPKR